ncbi:helix-turn-helix transcriptional regulator [Thermosipho globiformans]|uniref:helix-turn-helix transcriptional regulator n=1 Tax=Thermosipho globiformans TaxID=380685 RepID=UPI000F8CA850|nr:helix-turn-helix transcriptional regulator [Thermosipho globiformans]
MTLAEMRQAKNLTQQQLAKAINISRKSISHYETGRARPSLDVIIKLAKVLEVSVEEIYNALPKKEGEKEEFVRI